MIKSTEIRVYLKLTVIKYDFPLKESPLGHYVFSFFINLNRLGFDDVITLIKMELTWYKRWHLVSKFNPWLFLMLHVESQEVHMENLI